MWHKLSFALLFVVLTCGQIASAQISRQGKYKELKIQIHFKWPVFSGVWYEHSRCPNLTKFGEKCVYRNYTNIKKDTCEIKFSGLSKSNQPVSSYAAGLIGPGFLVVSFANGARQVEQILGTDYKSWAAIHSCQSVGNSVVEKAWILARKRKANAQTVAKAEDVLNENNFPTKSIRDTIQYGCAN